MAGKDISIIVELKVKIPGLPGFINAKDSKGEISIPVKDIDKNTLRKIGRAWTEELVKKGK